MENNKVDEKMIKHIKREKLSAKNCAFILQQLPTATCVGGRRQWFWAKRQVVPEAQPLKIWAPIIENGIVKHFIEVEVFDISQTEKISLWKALKNIVREPGDDDIDEGQAITDKKAREKARESAIKALSVSLKKDAESGNELWKMIKTHGGLKSKNNDYEDYSKIVPLFLLRKRGLSLDEMASELGMDDAQLWNELIKAKQNKKENKQNKRYWHNLAEERYYMENPGEEPLQVQGPVPF